MATGSTRDLIRKAQEASTGLRRVSYATADGKRSETDTPGFTKPVLLQEHSHKDTKGAIFVFDSAGVRMMDPFYNLVISSHQYGLGERVARTPVINGEHRLYLGKAPIKVGFSVGLYNFRNEPWKDQFIYLWNNVFRGTVLQDVKGKVYVYCGGDIFIGDMSMCNVNTVAENDGIIQASFQMECDEIVPYLSTQFGSALDLQSAETSAGITNEQIESILTGINIKKMWT